LSDLAIRAGYNPTKPGLAILFSFLFINHRFFFRFTAGGLIGACLKFNACT
jgi:hypothetical protein